MKKENKTPLIRFKGFSDDWEQRKLGEVFVEYSQKNHTELPPLTIIQGGGTVLRDESDRNLMYDKANLSNYKMVRKGDFIVHLRSFEGGLELATNTGVISPAYHTLHGDDTDSRFYYSYFRSRKFIDNDLTPHVYGIRDGRSIDIEGMKTINIPYTSFAEQKAIGDYISNLDNLITLHQRKCESLKKVKKSMLQKMFPKNGESVPEIRFAGFTDDWEQRKLGEVCDYVDYRGKTPKKTESGIFLVTAKNVKAGYIDYESSQEYISEDEYEDVMHRGHPKLGDVLITTEAPCGNVAQVNREDIALAQRIIKYRGHKNIIDNTYLNFYLLTPDFQRNLFEKSSGGTVQGIKGSVLHQQEICFPKFDEQAKIGSYFQSLDNLITLHQRKVEKLKNIKKSMLQKMFV